MRVFLLVMLGQVVLTVQYAIKNTCWTVEDVLLTENESKILYKSKNSNRTGDVGDMVFRCWRVLPAASGVAADQVVRVEINNLRTTSCEDSKGLHVTNGLTTNENKTIAYRCTGEDGPALGREVYYSMGPHMFLRWVDKITWGVDITVSLHPVTESTSRCSVRTVNQQDFTIITSDNYPNNFGSNTEECWFYTNPDDTHIFEISFPEEIKLNIPYYEVCYTKLEIYAWDTTDSSQIKLLHRVCTSDYDGRYIYITHGQIYLRFVTSVMRHNGFKAHIITVPKIQRLTSECKSVSLDPSSLPVTISSPNYPDQYTNDIDMCWTVQANSALSEGYNINLYGLGAISLEPEWNQECATYSAQTFTHDRLDIVQDDGGVHSLCGSRSDFSLELNETVTIRFRTNSVLTSTGFKLLLMLEPRDCGELYVEPGLQPLMLNYEGSNPISTSSDDEKCWKLSTRGRYDYHVLHMDRFFASPFRLQININQVKLSQSGDCLTDFVRLYDGSTLLKLICPGDNTESAVWYTPSNTAVLKIKSSVVQNFNITVKALHEGLVQVLEYRQTRLSGLDLCSQKSFSLSDSKYKKDVYFSVFSFANDPDYGADCVSYSLSDPAPGDQLQLKIDWDYTSFGPPSDQCNKRFITVYDGPSMDSPVLTHLCWEKIDVITASGPSMTLVGVATDTESLRGQFSIVQSSTKYNSTGCIEIPINDTETKYYVSSPNYGLFYPGNQDVCWIAYLPSQNDSVRLGFYIFRFDDDYYEDLTQCHSGDTLTLTNGTNTLFDRTFCEEVGKGTYLGNPYLSNAEQCTNRESLKLRFTSDADDATTGFYGFFSASLTSKVCYSRGGGSYIGSDGSGSSDGPSAGKIVGIIFGCLAGVLLLVLLLYYGRKECKGDGDRSHEPQHEVDLPSEQEQMERVSAPPSYNHVLQHNSQFPVTSRATPGGDDGTRAPTSFNYNAAYQASNGARSGVPHEAPSSAGLDGAGFDGSAPPAYGRHDQGAVNAAYYSPPPRGGAYVSGMSTVL